MGLCPRRGVHLRDRSFGYAIGAIATFGKPNRVKRGIIRAFEQAGQPRQIIAGKVTGACKALIMEGYRVFGKLVCHQAFKRRSVVAGYWRCRRTDGDIRHAASLWRLPALLQANNQRGHA